ncbi:hypothetical protein CNMCM6936_005324 [Aspergillus lentulus]|uniref:Uncharacterized protein n=1 Tax=Aspergillus lentulus TaxID=293939 RepID=A0AAN5YWI9_ASPLE|nr:hypothetical protein CNMCM6936_005324 [Aspergillus lentulus]KAF4179047.1 hypothetical protein CNMCM8060_003807 [Aspergillus lentulus]KAF4188596.1 hypothetical protein CNMCM7927_001291 [Aspergillus lentulus]KAF4193593.1 hypothetical protein CNMCM8694_008565 [Aspergillus lentulus]KAF4207003.1 hypothetical protein CNMCM8927_004098 [Aspergillus lentulus]
MKIPYFLVFVAATVSAQNAAIGLPSEGENLTPGSSTVVQIQRPNSLTGSQEIAVAIGLSSCADSKCYAPEDVLGTILYNGPFKPEYHESGQPPYQNFSVNIPEAIGKGKAQLNVAHVSLVGAGPFPFMETLNRTVLIA